MKRKRITQARAGAPTPMERGHLTVQEHANILHALSLYAGDCSAGECDHFEHAEPMTPTEVAGIMEDISGKGLAFQGGTAGRIDMLVWREHGDDNDSLTVEVFAQHDEMTAQEVLVSEHAEDPIGFGDDFEDGGGKAYVSVERTIESGDIITSHNGRRFRVTIEEVESHG